MRVNFGRNAVQGALALVLALVLPFASLAENGGEIRNYLISINRLYESLDYELALRQIQLGRQLPRSTDDEVTLSLYEGIILYEMRKQGPAASVFRSALLLRPDAKLPVQVAPKVEALFEFMRKKVKQEVATLRPPSGTEKPSNKAEPTRENPPAPPPTGLALEKLEDTTVARSPKKEAPSSVEPSSSTTQAAKADTKLPPMAPAPSALKAEQKKQEPVATQPPKSPGCGPKPASVSSRNQKDQQLGRLASMQHALCLIGKFQGVVAERWTELKVRMEDATTSYERTLITKDIDQFASEFVYSNPQLRAEQLKAQQQQDDAELRAAEAKRLEGARANRLKEERLEQEQRKAETKWLKDERREMEQLNAERAKPQTDIADTKLDTSKCQPIVSADCEQLMQRLLSLQEQFLLTNPSSKLPAIRELVTIGKEIRGARTRAELQQASRALDGWKQRQLPQ